MTQANEYLFAQVDKIALVAPSSTGKSFFLANSVLFSKETRFQTPLDTVVVVGRNSASGEIARNATKHNFTFELKYLEHCPKPDSIEYLAKSKHLCLIFEDPMLYPADELALFRQYWLKYCNAMKITAFCTLQGLAASTKPAYWREIWMNSNFLIFLDSITANSDLKRLSKLVEPEGKSDFLSRCLNVVRQLSDIKTNHLMIDLKNTAHGFKIRTLFAENDKKNFHGYGFQKNREI